jgi:hypothetical protein
MLVESPYNEKGKEKGRKGEYASFFLTQEKTP